MRLYRSGSIISAFFALAILTSAAVGQVYPLAGTWKANLAKSQLHKNHRLKSVTMRFDVSADVVSLTYTGVNMAGQQESSSRELKPDGKEYPIAQAPGIVEITRWVSSRTLESIAKKDGKVVGHGTYEVSADGKTMIARIKGIDGGGRDFEQTIVFDRE